MNKSEIEGHVANKAKYPDYPALPKFLIAITKEEKQRAKRLCVPSVKKNALGNYETSLISGFKKRVGNWRNNHQEHALEITT